jgi:hypothetical protein
MRPAEDLSLLPKHCAFAFSKSFLRRNFHAESVILNGSLFDAKQELVVSFVVVVDFIRLLRIGFAWRSSRGFVPLASLMADGRR